MLILGGVLKGRRRPSCSDLLPKHRRVELVHEEGRATQQKEARPQTMAQSHHGAPDKSTCAHGKGFSRKQVLLCACSQAQMNLILVERPKRGLETRTDRSRSFLPNPSPFRVAELPPVTNLLLLHLPVPHRNIYFSFLLCSYACKGNNNFLTPFYMTPMWPQSPSSTLLCVIFQSYKFGLAGLVFKIIHQGEG